MKEEGRKEEDKNNQILNTLLLQLLVCHLLCPTLPQRIFFLSLDAHNQVDDYSGTLGGVGKVHISALVTSS